MSAEVLQREVRFRPAFDKRDPDPRKNYGIGSLEIIMILKGSAGAVTFTLLMQEMLREGTPWTK